MCNAKEKARRILASPKFSRQKRWQGWIASKPTCASRRGRRRSRKTCIKLSPRSRVKVRAWPATELPPKAIPCSGSEIGPELLPYIVDRSPLKQGLYTPGTHIPVVAPERLLADSTGLCIVAGMELCRRNPRTTSGVRKSRRPVYGAGSRSPGALIEWPEIWKCSRGSFTAR